MSYWSLLSKISAIRKQPLCRSPPPSLPPSIPPPPLSQQSNNLQMLLQYVIFPADENLKCVTTELWVEPQYGHVLEAPPGLHYLKRLQHGQISDKVLSVRGYKDQSLIMWLAHEYCL